MVEETMQELAMDAESGHQAMRLMTMHGLRFLIVVDGEERTALRLTQRRAEGLGGQGAGRIAD